MSLIRVIHHDTFFTVSTFTVRLYRGPHDNHGNRDVDLMNVLPVPSCSLPNDHFRRCNHCDDYMTGSRCNSDYTNNFFGYWRTDCYVHFPRNYDYFCRNYIDLRNLFSPLNVRVIIHVITTRMVSSVLIVVVTARRAVAMSPLIVCVVVARSTLPVAARLIVIFRALSGVSTVRFTAVRISLRRLLA